MATRDLWRPDADWPCGALPPAEPATLVSAALAAPAVDAPLIPGESCPDDDEIRALWRWQAHHNWRCGRRRWLLALYQDGAPLAEIAAECGYANAHAVSCTLRQMGIPPRKYGGQA